MLFDGLTLSLGQQCRFSHPAFGPLAALAARSLCGGSAVRRRGAVAAHLLGGVAAWRLDCVAARQLGGSALSLQMVHARCGHDGAPYLVPQAQAPFCQVA